MSRTPVLVVAAAIIAGFLWVQQILGYLGTLGFLFASPQDGALGEFLTVFPRVAVDNLIEVVLFCVGWFVSVRYLAPVRVDHGWMRTIGRGAIATLVGTLAIVVGLTVIGFVGSLGPGGHPFGFAFDLTIANTPFVNWAYGTAQYAFQPFFNWFPLATLGCVLLKIWLGSHPVSVDATEDVSVAG